MFVCIKWGSPGRIRMFPFFKQEGTFCKNNVLLIQLHSDNQPRLMTIRDVRQSEIRLQSSCRCFIQMWKSQTRSFCTVCECLNKRKTKKKHSSHVFIQPYKQMCIFYYFNTNRILKMIIYNLKFFQILNSSSASNIIHISKSRFFIQDSSGPA